MSITSPPVQVERRVGQRFPCLLPVAVRLPEASLEGVGIIQDLSCRGVFFFTEMPLTEGAEIELTLRMPSEITLGDSMPVRCRGRVLRTVRPAVLPGSEGKVGVAARLESYEYLAESSESSASFQRVSTLHRDHPEDRQPVQVSPRPLLG